MADQARLGRHVPEPVDPDVEASFGDLSRPAFGDIPLLSVIALGGVIGALARYGSARLWRTTAGQFPWTTLWVNVVGCALIGLVIVLTTEVFAAHRLARPFLSTGILGGFTTFSTYSVDAQRLIQTGHAGTGTAYLLLTLVAAIVAVTASTRLTRLVLAR